MNKDDFKNENFYHQIGSSWTLDGLFLYLNTPLSMIGFILNFLSYFIIYRIKQKTRKILYSYLTNYTLFSMTICLLNALLSVLSSPRYFDFIFTYSASFIKCNILLWANTSNYFILNVMDCILQLERLTITTNYNFVKKFFKLNHNFVCFCVILACCLINLSSYFVLSSRSDSEYIEAAASNNLNQLINFTYCYRQPYFFTQDGQSLLVVTIVFRDFVSLIIECSLSIYSIISLRRYIKQTSIDSNLINLNTNNPIGQIQSDIIKRIEKYNVKLTKMTLYLSMCSIISHIGVALFYFQLSNEENDRNISVCVCILLISLKYLSNFFLFYQFNSNFKFYLNCKDLSSEYT